MPGTHQSLASRISPLAVALVMAAVVFAGVFLLRGAIERTSAAATRGRAMMFIDNSRLFLKTNRGPPSQEKMQEYLDQQRQAGLRYVAMFVNGEVDVAAGTPLGDHIEANSLARIEDRVRFVSEKKPPPLPGRGFGPPGRGPGFRKGGDGHFGPRGMKHRPSRPDRFRRDGPPDGLMRKGAPRGPDGPGLQMVVEFQPLLAGRLHNLGNAALLGATVVSLLLVILALAFTRAQKASLQMSERLEQGRRLAALGEMSAVLAHEIRNPLASLKGHAQLLVEQMEPATKQHKKAERIVNESLRLEALTNDLLEFVRTGKLGLGQHDLHAFAYDVMAELPGDRVTLTPEPNPPQEWIFDRSKMSQVLLNLLRNAMEASPGESVELEFGRSGRNLRWVVRDRGPGLGDVDPATLFEPFVTGRVRGTGLGLAITKRIIERHGGTIVGRNHAHGAEFVIELPPGAQS